MSQLVNDRGQDVRLGRQLTTPGGEGAIFEVLSEPSLVAKVYHTPAHAQKAAKLEHQVRAGNAGLANIAAWPRSLLFARNDRRTLMGFLMPRIAGKEIHQLYNPRARAMEFPEAAWDFLIHVARNCAAAFETLHDNHVVMSDVNEKNLLVTRNGMVRLIDCDSYQIRNGAGYFLCDVGVPLWTAPELQGKDFRGLPRTPNHDRFGLAVLIFELLFMGRHPFAGVPEGQHHFEIDQTIGKFLFAFSPHTWKSGLKQPPHTLPLAALPARLVRLFERAFLPGSEQPNARPTGREWAHELDALHTAKKICGYDPGHMYWNGLTSCPWCHISAVGGPNFFVGVAFYITAPGGAVDVSGFWNTIQVVLSGELMRRGIGVLQLPSASARPMPVPRPAPPRLGKPVPPAPVPNLPPPVVVLPLLPHPPDPRRIATPFRFPLSAGERDLRTSGYGTLILAAACIGLLVVGLTPAGLTAGGGAILFLFIWAARTDSSREERRQRREAEAKAAEEQRCVIEEEHARAAHEHGRKVAQAQAEHARALAEAQSQYARDKARLEWEFRSRLSVYSAQLSLFENAMAKYEDEERKWQSECAARSRAVEETRRELNECWERRRMTLETYQSRVRSHISKLEAAYQSFQKAAADEVADIKALESKKRDAQLRQFLDTKLIGNHRIRGIGPVKAATLAANGVESALDITPTMSVLGVGPVLLTELLGWRSKCEKEFRYNPNTPLPKAELQSVKLKYAQVRQPAFVELRGGAGVLTALETEARRLLGPVETAFPRLARAHAQALADYKECS